MGIHLPHLYPRGMPWKLWRSPKTSPTSWYPTALQRSRVLREVKRNIPRQAYRGRTASVRWDFGGFHQQKCWKMYCGCSAKQEKYGKKSGWILFKISEFNMISPEIKMKLAIEVLILFSLMGNHSGICSLSLDTWIIRRDKVINKGTDSWIKGSKW